MSLCYCYQYSILKIQNTHSIMEKMVIGSSLEYESINDRISRLRKDMASLTRTKQRSTAQPTHDRTIQLRKFDKDNLTLRLEPPSTATNMRIDINSLSAMSALSPRKYGITKRAYTRVSTEDNKKEQQQNRNDSYVKSSRVPGKIKKNIASLLSIHDSSYLLKLSSKVL